jgi:nucleolar protein 9
MPKENKHARGRRDAKNSKRKRSEKEEDGDGNPTKRQRSTDADEIQFQGTDNVEEFADEAQGQSLTDRPFFGLLSDEEQEYFRRADELLELNDFPSADDRDIFLANVYKEAEGKELKIANSQSSSRLMERLILLSTVDQKKKLFENFSGHFLHLIQHRFASHCCEALFIHSAPVVTQELTAGMVKGQNEEQNGDGVYVSMENLFLYTLNELEGHMNFLLTDKFASHALRVLLVVLSGQPLAKSSTKSLLQSKRKEQISITGLESSSAELSLEKCTVPESFDFAVSKIISDVAVGLDTTFIHVLATHPTGNPTLQLLLELEFLRQGNKNSSTESPSIIQKLLPDDPSAENSKSASFINGLIYDPIGSRLLETIVSFAPGKLFKQIYRSTFKDRIASLARNEIASFVVIKVLERLSKQDLEEAVTSIIPQVPSLIERHRTTIVKTLLERCSVRGASGSIALLTTAVDQAYGSDHGTLLLQMTNTTSQSLEITASTEASKPTRSDSSIIHGSLLAQTMLSIPGPPSTLLQAAILTLQPQTLLHLCCTTSTSHILQAALQPKPSNLSFRRKLINTLLTPAPPISPSSSEPAPNSASSNQTQTPILTLATSKPGSHVLDALWTGTTGLMMLKERICSVLQEHEAQLRNDFVGRVVLRNWMVELFGRRKGEWVKRVRAGEESGSVAVVRDGGGRGQAGGVLKRDRNERVAGARQGSAQGGKAGTGKTAIELAREKFAMGKAKKEIKLNGKNAGAKTT